MFTLFFRAMLLYAVLILTMRLLGKRQLGELQPYEFALTILLADIISEPISGVSVPLLYGLLPVSAVIVLHGIISVGCLKSSKIHAIVCGKPTVVIHRGVIDRAALDKLCITLGDLLEGIRSAGFLDPAEVDTAVVESNGTISAFQTSVDRPPKASELDIHPGYEGPPMFVVMDGKVQQNNLAQTRRDRAWLDELLAGRGLTAAAVYLASLDTQGRMTVQLMDGTTLRFQALEPGEVCW